MKERKEKCVCVAEMPLPNQEKLGNLTNVKIWLKMEYCEAFKQELPSAVSMGFMK